MESIRQKKITTLIQEKMAEIFRREISGQTRLISVSQVRISPDLRLAKIYLSIFPVENKEQIFLHIANRSTYYKNLLARCIRNQLRGIPELDFRLDNSLDNLENVDRELRGEGENPIKS